MSRVKEIKLLSLWVALIYFLSIGFNEQIKSCATHLSGSRQRQQGYSQVIKEQNKARIWRNDSNITYIAYCTIQYQYHSILQSIICENMWIAMSRRRQKRFSCSDPDDMLVFFIVFWFDSLRRYWKGIKLEWYVLFYLTPFHALCGLWRTVVVI